MNRELDSVACQPLRGLDGIARRFVFRHCESLQRGQLIVRDADGEHAFGEASTSESTDWQRQKLANVRPLFNADTTGPLTANITVHNPRFYRRIVFGGGMAAAESLMDGDWTCDNLTAFVRIFIRNIQLSDRLDTKLAAFQAWMTRVGHWLRANTRRGSKKNIHEHYDLGNDFFSLFLDETMNYSCAVFETPETGLEEASTAKMERICRKLRLKPGEHLVEIGTGWGALAIHAAKFFGCQVTTTTISSEQYEFARDRIATEGLADKIQVLQKDYRDVAGKFDKLVSIEMIEAVGAEYYETYFRQCAKLLRPNGLMLLQGITIAEHRFRHHVKNIDFIRKHIFPGGCLPSVLALGKAASAVSKMRIVHLDDITEHYVRTLQIWRENFFAQLNRVKQLGYSDRFIRMWEYYLCYCEATFAERQVHDVQMMFAMPGSDFDPIAIEFNSGKSESGNCDVALGKEGRTKHSRSRETIS